MAVIFNLKVSSCCLMSTHFAGVTNRSWWMLTATCWNWCQFTTTHFGGYCQKTGVWSSHRGYLFHDPDWEWLYKEFVLGMLGKTKSIQLKKYR